MASIRRTLTLLVAAALLLAGAAGWYLYLHYSNPETVRNLVMKWAESACPKARFEIDSASASLLHGVCLRSLSLTIDDGRSDGPLASFESITIQPDRASLLDGKLVVRQVTLTRPKIHLHQVEDGSWNAARLLTNRLIRFPNRTEILVQDAVIHVTFDDPSRSPIIIESVSGEFHLGPPGEATWQLSGKNAIAKKFLASGRADFVDERVQFEANTQSPLDLAQLRLELPPDVREKFESCRNLSGGVHVRATATARKVDGVWTWDGSIGGELDEVSLNHDQLPYPIRDARGQFLANADGFSLLNAEFLVGASKATIKAHVPSWDFRRAEASGAIRDLELTPAIRKVLTEKARATWDKFHPSGFIDIEGRLIRLGEQFVFAGRGTARDAAFRFEGFPYPVDQVSGQATLAEDGKVQFSLVGRAKTAEVEIRGEMAGFEPPAPAQILIHAVGVPLDEDLLRALQPGAAQAVRDLRPGVAHGDVTTRIVREPGKLKFSHQSEVDVRSSEASWVGFPYRVENVRGHLSITPQRVVFSDFIGHADGATIRLRGQSYTQTDGLHLEVGIVGEDIALDDRLREAMPRTWQQPWQKLRAGGRANLICNVVRSPGEELFLEMEVDPADASIEPEPFPYRLHSFQGKITYRDKVFAWEPMAFQHGSVSLSCSGTVSLLDDGCAMEIRELVSDNLVYDDSFRRAAPPSLRRTLDYLSPTKRVGVRFPQISMNWSDSPSRAWEIEMDGGIAMKDISLLADEKIQNATGVVWYRGRCSNDVPQFMGNINFSKMDIYGFKTTNVRSSFRIDGSRFEMPNIRGDMYAGQVHASMRTDSGNQPVHECRLNLYGGRLREYAKWHCPDASSVDGLVYLDLFLEGKGESVDRLQGRGKLDVLEADIDRLPLLQDLFRIGNLQPPTGKAFEEVNSNFRIDDGQILIERLELLGPANLVGPTFNLVNDGEGTLNLNTREVEMMLSARWGRGRFRIPLITPSFNLANDQVWSFNVRGRLDDPIITPAPLKGFFRMIEGPRSVKRQAPTSQIVQPTSFPHGDP